jgi:hypothetical protein
MNFGINETQMKLLEDTVAINEEYDSDSDQSSDKHSSEENV